MTSAATASVLSLGDQTVQEQREREIREKDRDGHREGGREMQGDRESKPQRESLSVPNNFCAASHSALALSFAKV